MKDWSETRISAAHDLILATSGEAYEPSRLRMLPTDPDFGNWILLENGKLVGLLWAMRISAKRTRVLAFCVEDSVQGLGHGSRVWSRFFHAAKSQGMQVVQLEVRQDNDVAIGMYERRGLRPRGCLMGFYRGNDGWLMLGPLRASQ